MDPRALLEFLRFHRLAVFTSSSLNGSPQAAVVGFATSGRFEIVFDTLGTSRKAQNLRQDPRVALVIGGMVAGDERTVQYEGIADEPSGDDLDRLKLVYYSVYPDGPSRLTKLGLTYVRVRPTWVRYSDYTQDPTVIAEFRGGELTWQNE